MPTKTIYKHQAIKVAQPKEPIDKNMYTIMSVTYAQNKVIAMHPAARAARAARARQPGPDDPTHMVAPCSGRSMRSSSADQMHAHTIVSTMHKLRPWPYLLHPGRMGRAGVRFPAPIQQGAHPNEGTRVVIPRPQLRMDGGTNLRTQNLHHPVRH